MNRIIFSVSLVYLFSLSYKNDGKNSSIYLQSFLKDTPINTTVKFIGWDHYPITRWSLIIYSGNTSKRYESNETNTIEISPNDYKASNKVKIFFENMGLISKIYKIPDPLLSETLTMESFFSNPVYRFERPY